MRIVVEATAGYETLLVRSALWTQGLAVTKQTRRAYFKRPSIMRRVRMKRQGISLTLLTDTISRLSTTQRKRQNIMRHNLAISSS